MTNQNPQNKIVGKDGESMVLIPAGEFLMGAVDDDDMGYKSSFQEEIPQHVVELDAFYIDVYQVTNAQYKKFTDATGHRTPGGWDNPNFNAPNNPVVHVSWYDAVEYAEWAGKRLPTKRNGKKLHAVGCRTRDSHGVMSPLMGHSATSLIEMSTGM